MKPPMQSRLPGCYRERRSQIPSADSEKAIELLGTMQGGYNIHPLTTRWMMPNWHLLLPKHFLTRADVR